MLYDELLNNAAVRLVAIAAVITSLGIIWQKAVKPMVRKAWRAYHMVRDVTQQLSWMLPFFHSQMENNGGSTFKDQFDRMDSQIKDLGIRFGEFVKTALQIQNATQEAARQAERAAVNTERLLDARHAELNARLRIIEQHLEPTGLPVAITLQQDSPVEVTIVQEEGGA